jgi:hypothetical protein
MRIRRVPEPGFEGRRVAKWLTAKGVHGVTTLRVRIVGAAMFDS